MNCQIVFCEKNVARLLQVPLGEVDAGQVRVRMTYTAISTGTERANLTGNPFVNGSVREPNTSFPRMVGYSGSGVVDAVGEGVSSVVPGDRVVTYWGKHMLYNVLPERNVVKISSEKTSLKEASFVFISTFPLAAVRKVAPELGESCLVVGAGLLGLFAVQYAHLAGALPVIASDPNAKRREMALKLGADAALDPTDGNYQEQLAALCPDGVNTVIEVTGNANAMETALRSCARQARVALLGCTRKPVTLDLYHDVHYPGIQILGAHTGVRPQIESYPRHWTHYDDCRTALGFLEKGRLNIGDMITETHSPAQAYEVFNRLAFERDFPVGVVFDWQRL